jgi:hypothetical protein
MATDMHPYMEHDGIDDETAHFWKHPQFKLVSQHGPWTLSHFHVCVPLVDFECLVTFHVMERHDTLESKNLIGSSIADVPILVFVALRQQNIIDQQC